MFKFNHCATLSGVLGRGGGICAGALVGDWEHVGLLADLFSLYLVLEIESLFSFTVWTFQVSFHPQPVFGFVRPNLLCS